MDEPLADDNWIAEYSSFALIVASVVCASINTVQRNNDCQNILCNFLVIPVSLFQWLT